MSDSVEYKRHKRTYKFFRWLLRPVLTHRFAFVSSVCDSVAPPYIVLSNHNTDFDPLLISLSFPEHMYYVASEHVLRRGLGAWLLKRYFKPIPRLKGSTETATALDIMRTIREGHSVCIFAEGNRSFNGRTGDIPASTGKLCRMVKVPLITYKFEGGYLTSPRWSHTLRRGLMSGNTVNVYTRDELSRMTPSEINAAIARDLCEDERTTQEKYGFVCYKGKELASGIETALYVCPQCHSISSIRASGSHIYCTQCPLSGEYLDTGMLTGINAFFSVYDWDIWQSDFLKNLARTADDAPVLTDENVRLMCINKGSASGVLTSTGTMSMSVTGLCAGDMMIPLADIEDMSIYGRNTLIFTVVSGAHYEVKADDDFCARKYLLLYNTVYMNQSHNTSNN